MADMNRRRLLGGLGLLLAAPTIVRAASLMPIRAPKMLTIEDWARRIGPYSSLFSNKVIREHFDVSAIRDRNILLDGRNLYAPSGYFRSIPIRLVEVG